jgi:hypothetical protein
MDVEEINLLGSLIKDLGPVVTVLLFCLGLVWWLRDEIKSLFASTREKNSRVASAAEKDAQARIESNELMRLVRAALDNTSSVVANNTAALNATSEERHLAREAVQSHDTRSQEQFEKLKSELGKARGDIGILKERTK